MNTKVFRFESWLAAVVAIASSGQCLAADRVFLLGGQSNMVGQGANSELEEALQTPQNDVLFWSDGWVSLAPGHGNDTESFGPELSFAKAIRQSIPDDTIYLVKHAANGTALYDDWRPVDGPQYQAFMTKTRAALTELRSRNVDFEISGMLWMQGESDAKEGEAKAYGANLRQFISHMRDVVEAPDMPFIIGRVLTYYGGESGQADIVRATQVRVAEAIDRVAWFDTDDYAVVHPIDNPGHYGTHGQIDMGKDFAKKILEILPASSNP